MRGRFPEVSDRQLGELRLLREDFEAAGDKVQVVVIVLDFNHSAAAVFLITYMAVFVMDWGNTLALGYIEGMIGESQRG